MLKTENSQNNNVLYNEKEVFYYFIFLRTRILQYNNDSETRTTDVTSGTFLLFARVLCLVFCQWSQSWELNDFMIKKVAFKLVTCISFSVHYPLHYLRMVFNVCLILFCTFLFPLLLLSAIILWFFISRGIGVQILQLIWTKTNFFQYIVLACMRKVTFSV